MFLAVCLTSCGEESPPLPKLGADVSQIGVSGLSSGAYMAGQYHFAHSQSVMGAGIVAGGPYGCAESVFGRATPVWSVALAQNLNRAINGCTGTSMALLGVPNVARLGRRARERAGDGDIDPLSALKGDKVYLFAGKSDRTVAPSLVRAARELYESLGVAPVNIVFEDSFDAGHGFITEDEGGRCGVSRAPFVNDCDYDQAGALLGHIHGELKPPSSQPPGKLLAFSQAEFSGDGMADSGAVFVPDDCVAKPGCAVHVAFHGCNQNRAEVGDAFIAKTGYNRWAAANRLIVLYPQADDSTKNPQGCWDWWGYTGPEFLTKNAAQVRAVRAMVQRLGDDPAS